MLYWTPDILSTGVMRLRESKSEREREGENLAAGNKSVMEVSSWMQ